MENLGNLKSVVGEELLYFSFESLAADLYFCLVSTSSVILFLIVQYHKYVIMTLY
jgi:hypothetical protein